ncbi:MAG: cysteine synthase family protein [Armatimonadetes bacterium]|nr:cysteine synthase family protein [Armatimonadota bacterium]
MSATRRASRPAGPSLQSPGTWLLEAIGNTPLLRLCRITAGLRGVEVRGKAEWFNPGGSVKDRPVLRMIEEAERGGWLTPERILLDSTSGNAGIAYAMIGAAKGYRVQLVVPASAPEERRRIMEAYGAHLVLTDPLEGSDGAIRVAHRIYEEHPERYCMPDQYRNPANWQAHYDTTGAEILAQTGGQVTHFVAGLGTSGTLVGAGRRLKAHDPRIQIIAVQPDGPVHGLEGLRHMDSALVPAIYDPTVHDRLMGVRTEDAYAMVRRLAAEEGLLVGPSSGAAMVAALRVARDLRAGLAVVVLPDTGERYLGTALWRSPHGSDTLGPSS